MMQIDTFATIDDTLPERIKGILRFQVTDSMLVIFYTLKCSGVTE